MSGIIKMPIEIKRYYKRELYQYKKNKEKLDKIINNKEKANTRNILFLEQRITNIETVITKLNEFEKEVFDMIFNKNMDWLYCKTFKGIDKSTYYNIVNKCIYLLAEEEGEI